MTTQPQDRYAGYKYKNRETYWATMVRITQRINDDQDTLAELVYEAREIDEPLTWQEIADALGCTRQAAWERYTHARLGRDKSRVHPDQQSML
jgi:acetoacetate decarboxylase